jgi:hypothetical protein
MMARLVIPVNADSFVAFSKVTSAASETGRRLGGGCMAILQAESTDELSGLGRTCIKPKRTQSQIKHVGRVRFHCY